MVQFFDSCGTINIEGYRQAKTRVKRGKLGIYPKINGAGQVTVYLLHRNIDHLKLACSFVKAPKYFIHTEKKSKYGYHYVRLIEPYVTKWNNYMKSDYQWRVI